MHISFEELLSAGILPSNTLGEPGNQGTKVMGTQGMGVKAPMAAMVATMTMGFMIDWHMPNGMTLTMGLLSMMLASGILVKTLLIGMTIKAPGATPNGHFSSAPMQTCCPISISSD
jgi:hypothetical protein